MFKETMQDKATLVRCIETSQVPTKLISAVSEQGTDSIRTLIPECPEDILYGLVWHAVDETRCLTPRGEPRTMGKVARRFKSKLGSFENACKPRDNCDPSWFSTCLKINYAFETFDFGYAFVRDLNEGERKDNAGIGYPQKYYICDGCHRLLVLAVKLVEGVRLRPITLVYLNATECPKES